MADKEKEIVVPFAVIVALVLGGWLFYRRRRT
ncbi:LPXTG cell wall anchor domain-containing protein [Mycolicibacterium sp. XJ1819]